MIGVRSAAMTAAAFLLAACLSGCANQDRMGGEPRMVTAANDGQRVMLLDQVKKLEGVWEATDKDGKKQVMTVISVIAGGSAVREIMMPGTPAEMTNMYHMDGPTLVMTHYCAAGNQPRMRAVSGETGKIVFRFDSVTNYKQGDVACMGEMTLLMPSPDVMEQRWSGWENGKFAEHAHFKLTRKR